jgi:hypothetical protein
MVPDLLLGEDVGLMVYDSCGVASVIPAEDIRVIFRPERVLKYSKNAPPEIASLSLDSTVSLVIPLITLAIHTQEASNKSLLAFLILLVGDTTPVTAVVGTPTESDTLPSSAVSNDAVVTSCKLIPSNI